jgi:uncharacterized phage-associated protein
MFDSYDADEPPRTRAGNAYPGDMTMSAHDVAAVLRDRLPGLPTTKLHKLLYYCQGHHLATYGQPLFRETISAWDMGPVVGTLWKEEQQGVAPMGQVALTEAHLNTIGYVLSRYGRMTGSDLARLTHAEAPWRRADEHRRPGGSAPIKVAWIKDHFTNEDVADDEELSVDAAAVTELLRDAERRRAEPVRPDDPEEFRTRLARAR